jgi:hypothetical protein
MAFPSGLTTREILDVFTEEITAAGGTVSDTFDDGTRLFLRSILPAVREVRARDGMQGGVALRCNEEEIRVHPYLFRQVCRNGAIVVQAIQTRKIEWEDFPAPDVAEVMVELREAIRDCCSPDAFSSGVEAMRTASEREADLALQLLPLLRRLPQVQAAQVVTQVMRCFTLDKDRSAFGLVNAVTAVARDTLDPETRWDLEELGGGIPALLSPSPTLSGAALQEVVLGESYTEFHETVRTYRRA